MARQFVSRVPSQPVNTSSSGSSGFAERPFIDEGTGLAVLLIGGYSLVFYFLTRLFK
jgi:hypothetical protein